MKGFHPYFTSDGSVGLYNEDFNDIYHSATGALTEAYEKFVYPIEPCIFCNEEIKILDICYGIGYNSKSFLNFILSQKKFSKKYALYNTNIASIHTNNISASAKGIYTDKIDTDNIFERISVTSVDSDEFLTKFSPFIKTGVKKFKNDNLDFQYANADKFMNMNTENRPKIHDLINFLILEKLIWNFEDILEDNLLFEVLNDRKYSAYIDGKLKGIFMYYLNRRGINVHFKSLNACLHNIYYKYLSQRYKKALKRLKMDKVKFNFKNTDAREFIKNDNQTYNLIFLDAFTPNKCPCLWSYEFFVELFRHLDCNGMLLTYSTSASIRSAMFEAGFSIGNVYNSRLEKFTGTVAAKNNELIKYPLSEFDFGLLKTRAGIFYRDKNLNASNEAIIEERNLEVKNSERISSSQYIKYHKML